MGTVEFQKEQLLSSNNIERAEDVRSRWDEDNPDFGVRLRRYNFTLFFSRKEPRTSPNGERVFLCTRVDGLRWENDDWCDLEGIYVVKSEVAAHEKQYPFLTYPIATDSNANEANECGETDNAHFLTADDLCNRWSMSPAQLVDVIRTYSGLPVYFRRRYNAIDDVPF